LRFQTGDGYFDLVASAAKAGETFAMGADFLSDRVPAGVEFAQGRRFDFDLAAGFSLADAQLFFLPAEKLELLFDFGRFIAGGRPFGHLLKVIGPKALVSFNQGSQRGRRFGQDPFKGFGRIFFPGQLGRPVLLVIPGPGEFLLQAQNFPHPLVGVGRGLEPRFGEVFPAPRFPFLLAFQPGDLGEDRVQLFLPVLKGLLQLPDVLAFLIDGPIAGEQIRLLRALPGRGLLVAGLNVGLAGRQQGAFQAEMKRGQLPDALPEAAVALGRAGLPGQRIFCLGNLGDDVFQAGQVLFGVLELILGLPFFVLIESRSGGFLDQGPFFGRLRGDERSDGPLLDDEIAVFRNRLFPELVLDVLEPDDLSVEAVFGFPRSGRRGG